MPVSISPQAAALKSKGLDLDQLSEGQRELLAGGDSAIDATDAAAALKYADTSGDGFVDPKELGRLKETLLSRDEGVVSDGFGAAHLDERARALQRGLAPDQTAARQRFDEAAARLSRRDVPTAPLEQLTAERATLPKPGELEAAQQRLAARRGDVTTLSTQVNDAQARLTAAQRELVAATPDAVRARDAQPLFEREAERREVLLAQMPTPEAKTSRVRELKTEISWRERALDRTYGRQREELKTELKTLGTQLSEAEAFDPIDSKRAAADLRASSAARNPALQREANANGAVKKAQAELDALRGKLTAARTETTANERHVTTLTPKAARAELLDRQIAFLTSREQMWNLSSTADALGRLGDAAAGQVDRLALVTKGRAQLGTQVPALLEEMSDHRQMGTNMAFKLKELKQLQQLKADVASGKLNGKDIDLGRVDEWIAGTTQTAQNLGKDMETTAVRIVRQLDDPAFQAALRLLPPEEAGETLKKLTSALHGTKAGSEYFTRTIRPALESRPGANEFWREMISSAPAAQGAEDPSTLYAPAKSNAEHLKRSLSIIEGVGGFIAQTADAAELLDASLRSGLGLRAMSAAHRVDDLDVLREASALKAAGRDAEAVALLEKSKLGRFSHTLGHFTKSIGAVSSLLTVGEFFRDPSVRNALDAGGNAAELIGMSAEFASKGSRWAKWGGRIGYAAPVLSAIVGGIDTAKAANRGDQGGTIGNALITTGGIVATVGLAADGTVAGAVVGVPLNVIGGSLALIGGGIELIWGDSDTEKFLKENDLWVMSKAYSQSAR